MADPMTPTKRSMEVAMEIVSETELGNGPICMLHKGHFAYEPVLIDAIALALDAEYERGVREAADKANAWWEPNYHERYTKAAMKEAIVKSILTLLKENPA